MPFRSFLNQVHLLEIVSFKCLLGNLPLHLNMSRWLKQYIRKNEKEGDRMKLNNCQNNNKDILGIWFWPNIINLSLIQINGIYERFVNLERYIWNIRFYNVKYEISLFSKGNYVFAPNNWCISRYRMSIYLYFIYMAPKPSSLSSHACPKQDGSVTHLLCNFYGCNLDVHYCICIVPHYTHLILKLNFSGI